ncbi:hypothetical protein HELRODRAFT_178015 [Helobdella robusta]|uniref:Uncharacterized protein n=1 Tax=Helobdella robusta TaxID=6412 RepID=T1FCM0_HELRO|nr:hypothetical protein HELRODRAFT_178015 [Helobdella robusta]ESN97580.1 hypothetical protein HELRODRAFT_178015 [Helobdella robusta]
MNTGKQEKSNCILKLFSRFKSLREPSQTSKQINKRSSRSSKKNKCSVKQSNENTSHESNKKMHANLTRTKPVGKLFNPCRCVYDRRESTASTAINGSLYKTKSADTISIRATAGSVLNSSMKYEELAANFCSINASQSFGPDRQDSLMSHIQTGTNKLPAPQMPSNVNGGNLRRCNVSCSISTASDSTEPQWMEDFNTQPSFYMVKRTEVHNDDSSEDCDTDYNESEIWMNRSLKEHGFLCNQSPLVHVNCRPDIGSKVSYEVDGSHNDDSEVIWINNCSGNFQKLPQILSKRNGNEIVYKTLAFL